MEIRKLFFILAITVHSSYAQSPDTWTLVKSGEGIHVYTRNTEGSRIRSVRLLTHFHCSLKELFSIMMDVNAHPYYITNCERSDFLGSTGDTVIIYHSFYDFPWPASDRDVIIRATIQHRSPGRAMLNHGDLFDYEPESDRSVRIREYQGQWDLTVLPDGTVSGEYTAFIDPGGIVPAWFINLVLANAPYESMKKLHALIRDRYP